MYCILLLQIIWPHVPVLRMHTMQVYTGVRSCPTNTYNTLTHCKINQLYFILYMQ